MSSILAVVDVAGLLLVLQTEAVAFRCRRVVTVREDAHFEWLAVT